MKRFFYGIQNRFLKYVIILLSIALLLSSVVVGVILGSSNKKSTIDKYKYITKEAGTTLKNLYEKSNETMKKCILQKEVQRSLQILPMSSAEKEALKNYLLYVDLDYIQEYVYVVRNSLYTKPYRKVKYNDFSKSKFTNILGDDYSKTKWFWEEDTLFNGGASALFIGRYIRNMDFHYEPGILFFKMDFDLLNELVKDISVEKNVLVGLANKDGTIIKVWGNEQSQYSYLIENAKEEILLNNNKDLLVKNLNHSTIILQKQEDTQFSVFTIIPSSVLNQSIISAIIIMCIVFIIDILVAIILSIYFSKRFTSPIKTIEQVMTNFDKDNFSNQLHISTNTELDAIGNSYNLMITNMKELIEEVKHKEKELRESELRSLIYQINPHFLYNTLDTIYMLARINKEETTMKMIQALSKVLRISLSKGADTILISEELEHVKSYMEIQKIRNNNLFDYEIICEEEVRNFLIIKLILQPIVENGIKHGFSEIYEGGKIRINIYISDDYLFIKIYNSGTPMNEEVKNKINNLTKLKNEDMGNEFSGKENGYGIVNVISRLRLKYNDNILFYFETYTDGSECTIKIPRGELF